MITGSANLPTLETLEIKEYNDRFKKLKKDVCKSINNTIDDPIRASTTLRLKTLVRQQDGTMIRIVQKLFNGTINLSTEVGESIDIDEYDDVAVLILLLQTIYMGKYEQIDE